MNNQDYKTFYNFVAKEDKDKSLLFILDLFEKGKSAKEIYEDYLVRVMNDFRCDQEEKEICIWKEHTRTSIIRTILESSYKYLINQKLKSNSKSVLVLCPQEEYHEIGAIIATHYFTMFGFDAKYIGANTPSDDIISAIKAMKPDYLALSVTNYYNIVVTKKLTDRIRKIYPDLKIIVGGFAFNNPEVLKQIEYDFYLNSHESIKEFSKGNKK